MRVGLVVNPLTFGFLANCTIWSKSAPSAKTFIFIAYMSSLRVWKESGYFQNDVSRFNKRRNHEIRLCRAPVAIVEIDEDALASCRFGGFHVAPTITDHDTAAAVKIHPLSRSQKHAGLGFSAVAVVGTGVITRLDGIERNGVAQPSVHFLNHRSFHQAVAYIGLICDDHEAVACILEALRALCGTRINAEFTERAWGIRSSIAEFGYHQHTIPVDEYGALPHVNSPLCLADLQIGMRDETMPDDPLHALGKRCHARRIHLRNDDDDVAFFCGVA